MIKMEDLFKILKLVLISGNLKGVKPISLLIIGKSGVGKTELITHYKKNSVGFYSDLSYMGLLEELKKFPKLKHIIIPDFIKITQKKRSTSDNFVSLLNALTEEGVGKIRMYRTEFDFNQRQIGIITATTRASFGQHKTDWYSFGFVQRMLIVSYDYSDETIEEIFKYINKEEYIKYNKENLISSGKDIKSEEKFNAQLNKISQKNFRYLKILQTLTKANALLNKRYVVKQEDIDEIIRLSKFMNLKYTKI